MKVLVSYRGIPQSPGWATGDMVVKAFRALGHEVYPYAKYYQQNKWVEDRSFGLDDHDFDLILYMECNDGDPQYHELAVTRARKTACWLFDTSYYSDRCRSLVTYFRFDHIFLANPLTIREYKVWGYNNVSYLPYACDPELHMRPLSHPKTHDVVLVGSIRDDRVRLQKELAKHGVELKLIGGVFREAYVDTLASTKIVINQNPQEGRGLLNMRCFETPVAGALLLSNDTDFLLQPGDWSTDLRLCFECDDISLLANQCRGLLADEKTLNGMRQYTQNKVLARHTYIHRCKQLLETVFPHG